MLEIHHCNYFFDRAFDEDWLEKAATNPFSENASREIIKNCEVEKGFFSSCVVTFHKGIASAYQCEDTYTMSFQFGVSTLPHCPFPNRRSIYRYFIDFGDLNPLYVDELTSMWLSDSWMKLGVTEGEITSSLDKLAVVCRDVYPLFIENGIQILAAKDK